mmetsp:Transcript_13258/g.28647  ORF Transcript_13258/g.28647 Transcript_13258/m.28647 type:complete len:238 (+) Transcript_13258:1470-2183(+)
MQYSDEDAHHQDIREGPLPQRREEAQKPGAAVGALVRVAVRAANVAIAASTAALVAPVPAQPQLVREGEEPAKVHQQQLQVGPYPARDDQQHGRHLRYELRVAQSLPLPQLANRVHVREGLDNLALLVGKFVLVRHVERVGGRLGLQGGCRGAHGYVGLVSQVPHGRGLRVVEENVVGDDQRGHEQLEEEGRGGGAEEGGPLGYPVPSPGVAIVVGGGRRQVVRADGGSPLIPPRPK